MRGLIYTLGVAVVAGASFSHAALLPNMDYEYDGNAVPESSLPAWEKYFDGDASVSGGTLTVTTPGTHGGSDVNFQEYRQPGGAGNPWNGSSSGNTVEVKINSISNAAGYDWAGGLAIGTGVHDYGIVIGEHYISANVTQTNSTPADYSIVLNDAPHILRFTTNDADDGQLNLYVDGNTTPAKTWTGNNPAVTTNNRLAFGDLGNSSNGTVVWDYIQWTNDGAFAPAVPEPASLSLLGLGSLALIGRRRRK